jgi:hypothetical protein
MIIVDGVVTEQNVFLALPLALWYLALKPHTFTKLNLKLGALLLLVLSTFRQVEFM